MSPLLSHFSSPWEVLTLLTSSEDSHQLYGWPLWRQPCPLPSLLSNPSLVKILDFTKDSLEAQWPHRETEDPQVVHLSLLPSHHLLSFFLPPRLLESSDTSLFKPQSPPIPLFICWTLPFPLQPSDPYSHSNFRLPTSNGGLSRDQRP